MELPTIEAQVEEVLMGPKDNNNTSLVVIKGKRTKRQRPQSPLPSAIIPYGDGGGGGGNNIDQYDTNMIGLTNDNNNNQITNLTSTTFIELEENTEEEEDMANCLILLAQGQFRPGTSPKRSSPDEDARINKHNSRRLLETSAAGGTCKGGYYVYECRTCNRTFPSFQALGGHRASHKKPKVIIGLLSSDEVYDQDTSTLKYNNVSSSALSSQLIHRSNNNNNNHKPKVHECSICGAEFTSGQALGGHMRRHRAPIGTNTSLSLTSIAMETDHQEQLEQPKKAKSVLSLDLDLNLPAPEDDNRDSQFSFVSSKQKKQQQQSSLVFSAPALVDCHY